MKLKVLLLLVTLLSSAISEVYSQQDELPLNEQSFSERIFFGGNFGIQFGNVTVIDVSPLIGYRLTEKLSAGTGITYMYYRLRSPGFDFSTSIYGGRLFARHIIYENLFVHAEHEVLNLEIFEQGIRRINVTNILIGAGYRQHLGGRTYINLLALWNVNESIHSPYRNPIIRMGIGFGI